MTHPFIRGVMRWAGNLRHPTLFKLAAGLFLVDLLVPDPLPFIDELLFGLATLLLANWKQQRKTPLDAQQTHRD